MNNSGLIKLATLATIAVFALGCVPQSRYDDLNKLYKTANEQIADLQARLVEANARIAALTDAAKIPNAELQAQLAKAIEDRNKALKALEDAEKKIAGLGAIGPVVLPGPLDRALRDLAASDPDLLSYDPALGMVRFKSDLTFALGSTEVSPRAIDSLKKLAEILEQPIAERYEARIVGHTDNVRIAKAGTKEKHPDNWYLSVHRAIAVKDVLEKGGVPPVRLGVAGYGEYREAVPNEGRHGAEANRRVEIYLVPNTYKGPAAAPAAARTPALKKTAPASRPVQQEEEAPEAYK